MCMSMMFWSISLISSIDTTVKLTLFLEVFVKVVRVKLVPHFGLDGWLDGQTPHLFPVDVVEPGVLENLVRVSRADPLVGVLYQALLILLSGSGLSVRRKS